MTPGPPRSPRAGTPARHAAVRYEAGLDLEGTDRRAVDLGRVDRRGRPVRLAPQHEVDEPVGGVSELDERRRQTSALGVILEDELAVGERREDRIGLARELRRRRAPDRSLD